MRHPAPKLVGLSLLVLLLLAGLNPAADPPRPAGKHALLVGCSVYENLDKSLHLQGPANDVVLMHKLLTERFGFPPGQVSVLAEAAGKEELADPANIQRGFERLAKTVQAGDQVVILLAGHGNQQPDGQPDDPEEREPDGLDEIFLPRDVGAWDGGKGRIVNAIVDDDIRGWLKQIQDKKAAIWIMVDACHSGSMIRGGDEDKLRQVLPGQLIPPQALEQARKRAQGKDGEKTRGAAEPGSLLHLSSQAPAIVALYAAQSTEPTVERQLPPDSPDRKPYGLLTFTVYQTLTQSDAPLTYRELAQRVYGQYVTWGRTFPTPLLEGQDQDREVLGVKEWPGRSRIMLSKGPDGLQINAGAVHGLTQGSILAVYPPVGKGGADQAVGHVQIIELDTFVSQVRPCKYGEMAEKKDLPLGRCEPVLVDLGLRRPRVAVDTQDNKGKPIASGEREKLQGLLMGLDKSKSLVEAVADPRTADWLLRAESGKVYLVPAAGWAMQGEGKRAPLFGPLDQNDQLGARLEDHFGRIARADNLKRLAANSAADTLRGGSTRVELEIRLRRSKTDKEGVPQTWQGQRLTIHDQDRLLLHLRNPSKVPLDMTVLYVDSGYGIACVFPDRGEINRLGPGETTSVPIRAHALTNGLEHLVVLAVKADGPAVDFAGLSQPTLELARQEEKTRSVAPNRGLESPLGKLLRSSVYGEGATRSVSRESVDEHALLLVTWYITPEQRPIPKEKP